MIFLLNNFPTKPTAIEGIPHLLRNDSKFTMYHNVEFHKGYIHFSPEIVFHFAVQLNARSR